MFLGALVEAGVSPKLLEDTVAALDIGARLEISRVVRSGISATKVDMYSHGEKDLPREVFWEQGGHSHSHDHSHDHEHGHSHGHTHSHGQREADARQHESSEQSSRAGVPAPHEHGRGLNEIRQIIGKASISETAKATSIRIFEALGAAEAGDGPHAPVDPTAVDELDNADVGADTVDTNDEAAQA